MNFEWDEEKNNANIRKHGFDFADAWKVFGSQLVIELDDRNDYGEDRWAGVGLLEGRIVKIIFTEPNENTIRVISLRKAKKYERQHYAETIKDRLGPS
ncbi:BrnT family toxin [soil metagenome]